MSKANSYEEMKNVLKKLIQMLVDRPEEVSVGGGAAESTYIFEVRVGSGEVGKVLGKKGRLADSIRKIMYAVCSKNRVRCVLDIVRDRDDYED